MANSTDPSFSKEHAVPQVQTKAEQLDPVESPSGPDALLPREHSISSISRLLKGKEREWKAVRSKMGPLYLLDLPVDILRLIVKEITHTNDLATLALTCSTLYTLAVPNIYARFDIVWPDSTQPVSDSKGVDALTYGLATLCLGSKFAQRTRWLRGAAIGSAGDSQRLVDNQYARYTRKFSLGNGPPDWVAEYNMTKESGKMLGTLVALAVAKMVNLETFIWDMPTGVLSDVFMALASLQDCSADGQSKLDKIWIRWHENREVNGSISSSSSPVLQPAIPIVVPPVQVASPIWTPSTVQNPPTQPPKYSDSQVEYPTFSVLPPLKSLTVLDIDELAYLDEMSILIERSKDSLQELRVGMSRKASTQDFTRIWEGGNLQQVDLNARWPGESTIGDKRLGGVLGIIVGRIYEIRQKGQSQSKRRNPVVSGPPSPDSTSTNSTDQSWQLWQLWPNAPVASGSAPEAVHNGTYGFLGSQEKAGPAGASPSTGHSKMDQTGDTSNGSNREKKRLDGKLKLHTLELERISLSMPVICKALDWSILTSLTILDCTHHETLWRVLKRQFLPTLPSHGSPPGTPLQYHLALKKIHTDMTTHALINFIKETLAPNTLEVLFLQDRRRSGTPVVTIEHIFKGAIKRHRSSMNKLLIDSSDNLGRDSRSEGGRWRHWVLTSDMLYYLTSGRMGNLKELAVALHYRDWHTFLQRLPNVPQLRSVYISHVQDYIGGSFEPKDLACQLVDIITLRPEIQLCYVGIVDKCFEILECSPTNGAADQFVYAGAISVIDIDDEDGDGDNDNSETDDLEEDDAGTTVSTSTDADGFTEVSDGGDSEVDDFEEPEQSQSAVKLRLREILFYDDKVAIFKARNGKL